MDLLDNKIHSIGDVVYFLIASLEEPFVYVRASGRIDWVADFGQRIWYHVEHYKFLETSDFISKHVHGHRFRLKSPKNDYLDKRIYTIDTTQSKRDHDEMFRARYTGWFYDVRSIMCFDDLETLNNEHQRINIELRDYLKWNLSIVESRIASRP